MTYVQQIDRETATRRRARFDKLRDGVRKGILPPLDDEMFRVHDLTFLLPNDAHPDEGRMIRDHAVRSKYARELSAIARELYDMMP